MGRGFPAGMGNWILRYRTGGAMGRRVGGGHFTLVLSVYIRPIAPNDAQLDHIWLI